jgi:hypothetical protein
MVTVILGTSRINRGVNVNPIAVEASLLRKDNEEVIRDFFFFLVKLPVRKDLILPRKCIVRSCNWK